MLNLSIITTSIGLGIISLNFMIFSKSPTLFTSINIMAGIVILGIPLSYKYTIFGNIKKIEATFPVFLRDVTDNINTGMTLPQAVRATCSNDYGALNKYVKEISAKIEWGIPLEKVLEDFTKKVNSNSLKRTVQTVIEAHHSGGTMNTVLEAVSESLKELEKIKKERSSSIYSQMINGYLIYVIFLGVMIGLSSFLIPAFKFDETVKMPIKFKDMFASLTVIQGFFAGMAVGKMAEGTFAAGIKHSLVLSIFGYTVFMLLG